VGHWDTILGLRRDCTDAIAAQVVTRWVNFRMGGIGRMINLQIDSKRKTIRLELELKGENEPIWIDVPSYQVVQKDGTTLIEFDRINISREWMEVVVEKYLKEKRFEIPEVLRIVL